MITLVQLQAYLAAGITVQTPDGLGLLTSLSSWGVPPVKVLLNGRQQHFKLEEVVPVLRPFPHLIEPLANGEVALVEMARLAHGSWEPGEPYLHNEFGNSWALLPHATGPQFFNVPAYFIEGGNISERQASYLRSRHFAVSFTAGQFIPMP